MRQIMFVAILSFTAATALSAQQPARPDCSASEHHQFDFWIGSWDVFNAQGAKIGTNEVTPILKGCVLKEHWEGGRGGIGESFSAYDRAVKQWHQTWVDDVGNVWKTDGNLVDGKMVLTRIAPAPRDSTKMATHRWTWTKEDSDHVLQRAEVSTDGGKTWQTTFFGRYARRRAALSGSPLEP
jgi:hypothetical protein